MKMLPSTKQLFEALEEDIENGLMNKATAKHLRTMVRYSDIAYAKLRKCKTVSERDKFLYSKEHLKLLEMMIKYLDKARDAHASKKWWGNVIENLKFSFFLERQASFLNKKRRTVKWRMRYYSK